MPLPPSGEQYTIRHGDHTAVVTEVGAGLRACTMAGRPVLDGYEVADVCTGGRGQTLIPWPNRVRSGRYEWNGRVQQLDLTEPERMGAIHGLTRWAAWRLADSSASHIRLRFVLHSCPGWPFILSCEVCCTMDRSGLTVHTAVTNRGSNPCPYGSGAHPYLHGGGRSIDHCRIVVPAARYMPVDEAGVPTGEIPVDGSPYDLRRSQPIGSRQLDAAFTALLRDPDGRARVRLYRPDGHIVTLWLDEAYNYLQIFTGDTLDEPERRRTSLAVEPMTCAPDAFNSGAGLIVLEPGQTHAATWGIELSAT